MIHNKNMTRNGEVISDLETLRIKFDLALSGDWQTTKQRTNDLIDELVIKYRDKIYGIK